MRATKVFIFAIIATVCYSLLPLAADDRNLWDYGPSLEFSVLGPAALYGRAASEARWGVDGSAGGFAHFSIPILQGQGILFDSNNIRLGASAKTSSDMVYFSNWLEIEPIAFAHIKLEGGFGTGWTFGTGTSPMVGLAINPASDFLPIQPIPFGGLVWNASISLPLILSLEYFLFEPMARLYLQAEPRIEYRALSAAKNGEAWVWNNDSGMNRNGWKFSPRFTFAIRPPLVWGLQYLGFEGGFETWLFDARSSSPSATGGWGSDLLIWDVSVKTQIAIDPWNIFIVEASVGETIEWTVATADRRFFGNRVFSKKGVGFKGLSLIYRYEY